MDLPEPRNSKKDMFVTIDFYGSHLVPTNS